MDRNEYERRAANERSNYRRVAQQNAAEGEVRRAIPKIAAYDYAMRVYSPYLSARMPRIELFGYIVGTAVAASRPLRLISLGCGTGDFEIRLAASARGKLGIELVDLDGALLESVRAAAATDGLDVQVHAADVNSFTLERNRYDFVLCRSSLHHFVELEWVLDQARGGLSEGGRFVVIGEWIGRRGLQLYPEQERIAQAVFERLPARYRRDSYNGEIRDRVPNVDHSRDSFEAIRSDEILPLLLKNLRPIEFVACDSLITPLLDFRFGPNYDTSRQDDRRFIEELVMLDIECLTNNVLKPTALFGLFAPP